MCYTIHQYYVCTYHYQGIDYDYIDIIITPFRDAVIVGIIFETLQCKMYQHDYLYITFFFIFLGLYRCHYHDIAVQRV